VEAVMYKMIVKNKDVLDAFEEQKK